MSKITEFENMIKKLEDYEATNPTFVVKEVIDFLKANMPRTRDDRKLSDCVCGCSGRECSQMYHYTDHNRGYFIKCGNCYLITGTYKTKIGAIRAWNSMQKILKEENQNGTTI